MVSPDNKLSDRLRQRRSLSIGASGIMLVAAGAFLALRGDVGDGYLDLVLGYLAMSVSYLVAVYHALRLGPAPRWVARFVVATAVVLRATFWVAPPTLSDDIYRYVWDGRVQLEGINPYRFPPDAPQLEFLRDHRHSRINNRHLPTVYPPASQLVFRAVVTLSASVFFMKIILGMLDLMLVALIVKWVSDAGLSPLRSLIYAWNPLVIVELAGSGHNDLLALLSLVAAHRAIIHKKDTLSICFLTLGVALKLWPLALAPLFLIRLSWRRLWIPPLLLLALAWPYRDLGPDAFRGLLSYTVAWQSNDSFFALLLVLTGKLEYAKGLAAGLYGGALFLLLRRRTPLIRACFLATGLLLILSPTVHPWYLIWIVPYLCFHPHPAWLLLTVTAILSYHAPMLSIPGEPWQEVFLFKALEYAPCLVVALVHTMGRSRTPPGGDEKGVV
jgi:hypothetical protein